MNDREQIADVINTLFVATDARQWDRVRGCFAAEVTFDVTSLSGGAPARLPPEQIAGAWRASLAAIEHVHHQTGNLMIREAGDAADASCNGIAYHYRRTRSGRNTRLFVGTYDFHLGRGEAGWRIDLFRYKLKFMDGNLDLEGESA